MKHFLLLIILFFFINSVAFSQKIDIWIVRHAEKDKSNPQEKDSDLSEEGKIRAADLAQYLSKVKFDAAFSTPYKRTHQTLDSLIKKNNITITNYNPADNKQLVENIRKTFDGKTIIIAGHSNTVLEIIEAFGAKRPKDELTDDDYDSIFHLTVKGDKAKAKLSQFGRPHHL